MQEITIGSKWREAFEFGEKLKDPYKAWIGRVTKLTKKVVWILTEEGEIGFNINQFLERFVKII